MTFCMWFRLLVLLTLLALAPHVRGEGHGPVFALATPTLGQGHWSSDTVLMGVRSGDDDMQVLAQMFGYGVHEDLQFNFKLPLARSGRIAHPPNMRGGMMGAARDLEAGLMWRFHREAPAVGTRRESTLHLGLASSREESRRGVAIGKSVNAAIATGYASRTVYWWLAGGWQRHFGRSGDRLGDLYYGSAAFGYRPARFRPDDSPVDLRWFAEAVIEFPQADRHDGATMAGTGGRRLLAGPSFLALGGPWGLSGGILFPVHERLDAGEPGEQYRAKLVITYWF